MHHVALYWTGNRLGMGISLYTICDDFNHEPRLCCEWKIIRTEYVLVLDYTVQARKRKMCYMYYLCRSFSL